MKINLSKKRKVFFVSALILGLSFFVGYYAEANVIARLLSWIVEGIISILGVLLMLIMSVLVKIAQYNDFIKAEPIVYGWVIVRDVCNMFFILILLIIAFATILRVEDYSIKKLLPKLLIMAVLINFSKLICGIFIDFAQVIMLTFVNGFKEVGEGNLSNMLGIDKLLDMPEGGSDKDKVDDWSVFGTYVLALIYVIVALVVVLAMVGVLAMRIIMLWVYVVLSPLAYLLGSFPAGKKYASKWWEEFSSNLVVGPVLAFFVWLSFASLGGVTTSSTVSSISQAGSGNVTADKWAQSSAPVAGLTEAGTTDHMIKFIISIGMLIGGLTIAQSMGGITGKVAGNAMGKISSMGSGALKVGRRMASAPFKAAGRQAVAGLARNKTVQNVLGSVGGSRGVGGAVAGALGLRSLATSGHIALNEIDKKNKEKAKAKANSITDQRIIARGANAAAITPEQKYAKAAFQAKSPSSIADVAARQKYINGMSTEQLNALSRNEWQRLGEQHARGDIDLTQNEEAHDLIQRNIGIRSRVNSGVTEVRYAAAHGGTTMTAAGLTAAQRNTEQATHSEFFGRDKDGRAYTNALGAHPNPSGNPAVATGNNFPTPSPFSHKVSATGGEESEDNVQSLDESIKIQHEKITEVMDSSEKKEFNDQDINNVRLKVDAWSKVDGQDHSNNRDKLRDAVNQVKEEKQQNVKIQAQLLPTDNVSADSVRGVVDRWNKADGKNNFDDPEQIKKAIAVAKQEAPAQAQNKGNLSINEFARGKSNTVALDFSKLNLPEILPPGTKNTSDVQGVSVDASAPGGAESVAKVAQKIQAAIDQEISKINEKIGKGQPLNKSEERRLGNLQSAKNKLSDPTKLKNIQLVNSGATNYNLSEVKDTKLHEEVHGQGFKDEKEVDTVVKEMLKNKTYGARRDKLAVSQIIASSKQGTAQPISAEAMKVLTKEFAKNNKKPFVSDYLRKEYGLY